MGKDENQIYLNVNPLCNDLQVIHVESTLGFNLMLLAKFECTKNEESKDDTIKVNKITVYKYPMSGLADFSILDVKVEPELFHTYRIIRILMGLHGGSSKKEVDLTKENIVWRKDDIVDNKISFDVDGHKYNRETLMASNPILNLSFPLNDMAIPVAGRPCQFKLVSPM